MAEEHSLCSLPAQKWGVKEPERRFLELAVGSMHRPFLVEMGKLRETQVGWGRRG